MHLENRLFNYIDPRHTLPEMSVPLIHFIRTFTISMAMDFMLFHLYIPSTGMFCWRNNTTQHTNPNTRSHAYALYTSVVCTSVHVCACVYVFGYTYVAHIHMMAAQMVGRQTQTKQCAMCGTFSITAATYQCMRRMSGTSQIQTTRLNRLRIGFFCFNFRCMCAHYHHHHSQLKMAWL